MDLRERLGQRQANTGSFTLASELAIGLRERGEHRRKVIGDLLESVNLTRDAADKYPSEFSGGQQQRVAVARASRGDC